MVLPFWSCPSPRAHSWRKPRRPRLLDAVSFFLPGIKTLKALLSHLPTANLARECAEQCRNDQRPFDCEDCIDKFKKSAMPQ
mmetsp:Transcript_106550/g.243967  ORF Transcript_106550/g.243967 Transcript_106550/m.243967 type:complete len:82 (-) Transcript_106550:75-320(-)